MIRCVEDIDAYQRAYGNSLEVHKFSMSFPKFEQFELASQLRRATKSIPVNIAEGWGKHTYSVAEFKRYLTIAIGSCDEVKVHLKYSKDLGYIESEVYEHFLNEYTEIVKMLSGLSKNWK